MAPLKSLLLQRPQAALVEIVTKTIADVYHVSSVIPELRNYLLFPPRSAAPGKPVRRRSMAKERDLDCNYVASRVDCEGLSFLTRALPSLGDWFDAAMSCDNISFPMGFDRVSRAFGMEQFAKEGWNLDESHDLPRFLYFPIAYLIGHAEACCFRDESVRFDERHAALYRTIRSVLHGLKKLELEATEEQKSEKLGQWFLVEQSLQDLEIPASPAVQMATLLLDDLLSGYEPTCSHPQHGPGAVAGGECDEDKWVPTHKFLSLHREWPYWEYLYPVVSTTEIQGIRRSNRFQLAAKAAPYKALIECEYPVSRMLFVPKDSRGPRIISCEPKELMYIQQGVSKHLVHYVEKHRYTQGHVNFSDQSINAELALTNSETRELATLDLSDASDSVSVKLLTRLFPERVCKKWLALRSMATQLPDGTEIALEKFAPMGSAMCFPVEALTFWALAVGVIWNHTNDLPGALKDVYVYGDDIIVPNTYVLMVVRTFMDAGLKVNLQKSFAGELEPFRESCGCDAYNGHDVTPLRVRKLPPQRPSDGLSLVAYCSYTSQALAKGMGRRAVACEKIVTDLVGAIPHVPCEQSFLGIIDPVSPWPLTRYTERHWDSDLCYWTSPLLVVRAKKRALQMDEWARLQRNCVESFSDRSPDLVVLTKSTQIRRKRVAITYLPSVG